MYTQLGIALNKERAGGLFLTIRFDESTCQSCEFQSATKFCCVLVFPVCHTCSSLPQKTVFVSKNCYFIFLLLIFYFACLFLGVLFLYILGFISPVCFFYSHLCGAISLRYFSKVFFIFLLGQLCSYPCSGFDITTTHHNKLSNPCETADLNHAELDIFDASSLAAS